MRDVFDPSSEDSASDTGALSDPALPAAQPKRPSKRGPRTAARNTEHGFVKLYLIAYLFYAESTDGLTVEEKTNLLKEHLRSPDQPE